MTSFGLKDEDKKRLVQIIDVAVGTQIHIPILIFEDKTIYMKNSPNLKILLSIFLLMKDAAGISAKTSSKILKLQSILTSGR